MEKEIKAASNPQAYSELSVIREGHILDIEKSFFSQTYSALINIINVEVITTPFTGLPLNSTANRLFKRSFDIVFSSVVIIGLLSWLIPIISLLIWIDSKGPVFFFQKRNKRNGELFTCIKFRSMIVNADADILPASRHDKRITRFGHFLRSHYLDELPQFINVLLGDMSVIGPRPHMITDNLKYEQQVDYYTYRHNIKPGITGLSQILGYVGAPETLQEIKQRVSMDIFYQRHWSAKLDMIILWKTIGKLFRA